MKKKMQSRKKRQLCLRLGQGKLATKILPLLSRFFPIFVAFFIPTLILIYFSKTKECDFYEPISLRKNDTTILTGKLDKNQSRCYRFKAEAGQSLALKTNTLISLFDPKKQSQNLQGLSSPKRLSESGEYLLKVKSQLTNLDYQIEINVKEKFIPDLLTLQPNQPHLNRSPRLPELPTSPSSQNPYPSNNVPSYPSSISLPNFTNSYDSPPTNSIVYNVNQNPPFNQDKKLQKIVDKIVNLARNKGLPTNRLSVSLVNLSQQPCCAYASYQDDQFRYPGSVVKLFWLVIFYDLLNNQGYLPEQLPLEYSKMLAKMIKDSDNEYASKVVDVISGTKSSKNPLTGQQLEGWINQRLALNDFFNNAGYPQLNISQKTFPIPYLLDKPEGADLQIRGKLTNKPIRNYLNTYSMARLLYEIYQNQAISPIYSQAMKQLMKRNLNPAIWKPKPYDAIEGFLGQSLPLNTQFYSKMGWTFSCRNDGAIISTPDGRTRYILVVFGDAPEFYVDKGFFPELSQQVYQEMTHK